MKEVFLHLNLSLGIVWLIFQFLPLQKINFRTRTRIARVFIMSSLISVAVVAIFPDSLFPEFLPKVSLEVGRDVNTAIFSPSAKKAAVNNKITPAVHMVKNKNNYLRSWPLDFSYRLPGFTYQNAVELASTG